MEENKNILTEEKKEIVQNNNPQLIPSKSNKGLIAFLVVIILLLASLLVYFVFLNKKEEPNNQTEETTQKEEETKKEEVVVNGNYELTIYRSVSSKSLANVEKPSEYHEEAFKLKVNTKDAKVIDIDDKSLYVLYKDDGIYLYDVNNKKTYKVELDNNYEGYAIVLNTDGNKIIGISYIKGNGDVGFYNYAKSKKMYDGKFKVTEPEKDYYVREIFKPLNDKYMTYNFYGENDAYILNINDEKEELKFVSTDESNRYINTYGKDGKNIYYVCGFDCEMIYAFYSSSLKQFFNKSTEYSEFDVDLDKKTILINDTDGVKKFDFDGNLVKTYTEFTNTTFISKDHVLYVKDNKLTIGNTEDETDKVELTTWNDEWFVSIFNYYSRSMLDEYGEKNKKEGWYVTVEYQSKDAKGNYGMEYCYTPDKQIVEYPIKQEVGGRAKPVLYLYPTKEINVTVKFEKPNLLTTTYPKYIDSWNVTVKPNGDMHDSFGKYYYALYWDEKRYNEVDFTEGFYVESRDAISFLEEKLTYIGLSDKERNEFIMYWLPIMERNGKNLVYFELTKERELGNKLIIEPKPDSLLRVSIHIKKVNEKINIPEQKLETFKRTGFTAIEWGGMTY